MVDLLQHDAQASYAFMGAPTVTPFVEECEMETQRFRIYRYAAMNLFGENGFEQEEDTTTSTYFILNNGVDKQAVKKRMAAILGTMFPEY